jgi:hypothetical protein
MNNLLEQTANKSYYVMGTNWTCYVSPNESDLEFLSGDELKNELCSKALEAYFGLEQNDSLHVLDKEIEPMIGSLLAITIKGQEENPDSYVYVPSYEPLGNIGKYSVSMIAKQAYEEFLRELERLTIENNKQGQKKLAKPKNVKKKLPDKGDFTN